MLLLFSTLVFVWRWGTMLTGLIAAVIAALALSFLFMEPVGSFGISNAGDQLLLILFLLISVVGCRFISGQKTRTLGDFQGPTLLRP